MDSDEKLEWTALEYEEKERGNDWFWALGVIVVAGSIASFIYSNYFFGLLLIIGGVLLGAFAIKKPDLVFYELNEKGLKIRNRLFPYKNIKSFWVKIDGEKPLLFIKSERLFMPIISMPVEQDFAEKIKNFMLSKNVSEEEMKEHPSEKIMDSLGF
ncbi:hypothetical protein A3B84_00600 [Candidatus Nomurabacteria bacterium RIFCSPHIGHO2_02_FULL_35_13]|uniref:DUF5673 domain-containing protein n=1 Tax=Candidatus Nomurabacteria bacterium RIFCSPHIGHO2_02_FULL_35_13 TaxID=1801748 RepID=A0A1F6VNV8_9BACT|nr:MAG: hypothetical protein A3B84_00600 [Candidatus Nomurabacteria bacterium RIFCSPHIGHO2_02_FULL_35_13]